METTPDPVYFTELDGYDNLCLWQRVGDAEPRVALRYTDLPPLARDFLWGILVHGTSPANAADDAADDVVRAVVRVADIIDAVAAQDIIVDTMIYHGHHGTARCDDTPALEATAREILERLGSQEATS